MKKRSVVWSEKAVSDMNKIVAYIAADNPVAALGVIARIEKAGNKLGHAATGRSGRVGNIYESVIFGLPYGIAYAIQSLPNGRERIAILRIIHGARN